MASLLGQQIVVGVTGGIAAYKSAELVRRLREAGASVRVVMTRAAGEFVRPLTFQAVSGNPVHCDLLDPNAEASMGHIELARWAHLLLIAPATADCLARLAHGLADDLLTTLCLATAAPIVLAPAMNQQMWRAAATQANCNVLLSRGVTLLGPDEGSLACGDVGPGRMLEPEAITAALAARLPHQDLLAGLKVIVTAGPTRERIDPVRYLTNRSSGRMGYAVAAAAAAAGATVTLISGPVHLPAPCGVARVMVESAAEMADAVFERAAGCDILIAAAAVADYRCAAPGREKIKKSQGELRLVLEPTQDILATVAAMTGGPFTVGFAAETENLIEYARRKLVEKNIDLIAANDVGDPALGFDSEENAVQVLWKGGQTELPRNTKPALARQLVALVAEHYRAKHTS
jgi:phosphopantothenoylcysteine decarboxylase/phosphopantothenate--cysteine ligase